MFGRQCSTVFLKLSFLSADFSQAGRYSVEVGAWPSEDPTMEAEGTDVGQRATWWSTDRCSVSETNFTGLGPYSANLLAYLPCFSASWCIISYIQKATHRRHDSSNLARYQQRGKFADKIGDMDGSRTERRRSAG